MFKSHFLTNRAGKSSFESLNPEVSKLFHLGGGFVAAPREDWVYSRLVRVSALRSSAVARGAPRNGFFLLLNLIKRLGPDSIPCGASTWVSKSCLFFCFFSLSFLFASGLLLFFCLRFLFGFRLPKSACSLTTSCFKPLKTFSESFLFFFNASSCLII